MLTSQDLFTRINNKDNSHAFVGELKMSQEFNSEDYIAGYAGKLGILKTSGNYQYDLYSIIEDDKYNS